MIRVVIFLLAVAVLAAGFVWFADRPGDVTIAWMGYRTETSVMVAALALAALVVVLMVLWIGLYPRPYFHAMEASVAQLIGQAQMTGVQP